MTRLMTFSLAICCALLLASASRAGSVTFVADVDNSAANAAAPGFSDLWDTNDIFVHTDPGQSIGALQILANLTTGTIFNHGSGGDTAPPQAFVNVFGDLGFDSYVAAGSAATGSPAVNALTFGASDMLGGPGGAVNTSGTRFDVTFSPAAGQATENVSNWLAARLTLSDDADGTLQFLADFGGGNLGRLQNIVIENGVLGGGVVLVPGIDVLGNGVGIADDDITPSLLDNTDFGVVFEGTVQTRAFTINNTGTADLTLGLPNLTGPFSVVGAFPGSIGVAGSAVVTIGLDTSLLGPQAGSLSFGTNVAGLETFNFDLAANVIPEPASITLFGLALIGMVGLVRRRS